MRASSPSNRYVTQPPIPKAHVTKINPDEAVTEEIDWLVFTESALIDAGSLLS
jgi:hypothetical protein